MAPVLQIPDHELIKLIASGGYGEVWLARNVVGTLRAVKIVRRDHHETVESFEREFNGLKKFEPISRTHEGFVDFLSLGLLPDDAGFYYVMELADDARQTADFNDYTARTLRADLRARTFFPADEVINLGLKLTAALAHLHAHGLLHRDVKPSNVLFIDGEPKLADAGLVAELDDAKSLVGTAGYIAPEGPGTARADLYALGKVLYEAAFGKDRQEFPALPANVASRPDHERLLELNAILLKACATHARERYSSVQDMQHELQLLSSGSSIRKRHVRERLRRFCGRVALGFSLIVLVGLIMFVFPRKEATGDVQSRIPAVNKLVADGYLCRLSSTPDRLKKSFAFFQEALKLDPAFVPARFGIFGIYVANGDLEGVRSSAAELVRLGPDSAEAQIALSYQLWIDWRFSEALKTARKSVEARAYTRLAKSRAHLGYGFQLLQTGNPQAALAQYEIAEEIGAKLALSDPVLEHHLGHPHLAQRNFAEALKHYNRSVELEPRHSAPYYWKARTYDEMEEFEKAIEQYAEYERQASLGREETEIKQRADQLREAARAGREAYWRKRLEMALKDGKVYDIATTYARLGDKKNAYEYLERACERQAFTQGLMFDLCWDHNDEHFKRIAKGIGIIQ